MAVDRKADYVGNNDGRYTDMDGMSKQFTYIDHDKKTTILMKKGEYDKDWQSQYRANLIERITDLPASICCPVFVDYTLRGDREVIQWNMDMLLDNGVPLNQLRDLCVLTENRAEHMKLIH